MKLLSEVRQSVLDFLNLEKKQHIVIVADDDEDGITSALQTKHYFEHNTQNVRVLFSDKTDLEKKSFVGLVEKFSPEIIVFLDLSEELVLDHMTQTKSNARILVIDHHPDIDGVQIENSLIIKPRLFSNTNSSSYPTTKIVFDLFNECSRFAAIGVIGDSALEEWRKFVEKAAIDNGTTVDELVELSQMIRCIISTHRAKSADLFNFLYTKPSLGQIKKSEFYKLKEAFQKKLESERKRFAKDKEPHGNIIFFETKKSLPSPLSNILSRENDETIVIYSKSDFIKGSVRCGGKRVNCGKMIKYAIRNSSATGGGHAPAGGFACPASNWEEFKKRAIKFVTSGKSFSI
ncbi:MAG: DHH family phosphoesterase [Candidatus Diapherotrites archaeon]|nr:DHH family phosphoesterase [Candidatus Diapherotrites archaeon]